MYLPVLILSPSLITAKITEHTVPMGLNMETNTGPFFFSAHPLKLRHIPLTAPACAFTMKIHKVSYMVGTNF